MNDNSKSTTPQAEEASHFGVLPAMANERPFGLTDYVMMMVGFGIAAWSFLIGGYTGSVLPASQAIPVILFGNAIPVLLLLGLAKFFCRYGVDTFIGARVVLGWLGSNVFLIVFAIINLGWMTMASFMLGESFTTLLAEFNAPQWAVDRSIGAPLFAIMAFLVAWLIAYRGPIAIKLFNRVGVPTIFAIIAGLIFYILWVEGLDKAFSAAPAAPYDDPHRGLVSAIEWNVGLGFSWAAYFGQWCRLAKTEKTAVWGSFIGWGVLLNIAAILGALTALLVGVYDPAKWMISAGGPFFGILGLLLLILANLTSATILVYSQGISIKTMFPQWSWLKAVATTLPAMLLMLTPTFYDGYTTFLSYISFIMAAIGAVMVVELVIIRRYRVDMVGMYDRSSSAYRYQNGINYGAYFAIILGGVFYFWTYNPVADSPGPLFLYMSAGLPTFFMTAMVYWAVRYWQTGSKKEVGASEAL
ncbi:cytosine/uracil/thiamine/allantoin permease [Litchfieldella qijiaojingensis]|uniref:Cytosine/uracil/thiamine/allantoin permease n=1 Tax=Litchfieldella qijiaojingensis TaxID=980347 RepID=A0ABQ2Z144_9GAMM|nr:cytosine permease [Halomonas qijiaojingensis]GGX98641.1 cytosine/uracil/thiamine/allantoin permease [Halomonas qijiaojingensis]